MFQALIIVGIAAMAFEMPANAACPSNQSCPVEASDWHLLTQAVNGTVSLLSGLTESQCETARIELDPIYQKCGDDYIHGCSGSVSDGDIKWSKCFK